jgi:hypothetical protein
MFNPRDIIRRGDTLYVVEQVVEDHRGSQVLVKELDGDSRWVFGSNSCEKVGGRPVQPG